MRKSRNELLAGILVLAILCPASGWAQGKKDVKYPNKPIDLIVPYAPGAGTDLSARVVSAYLAKKFGVPVNVVNVTGASGVTGMLQALRNAPDGYTMMMEGSSTSSFMFAARSDLPMKLEDRTFVASTMADYWYFFVNNDTGWKALPEVIQFIKSKPTEFRWGAGAFAAIPMFAEIDLFLAAGIDIQTIQKTRMVVFEKGNAPSVQAVITGDVQFAGGSTAEVAQVLATKRVRVLGVNAPERVKAYPDIPTAKEVGYPKADIAYWHGVSGPKGLPDHVVKAWNDIFKEAMTDAEAQALAAKSLKTWKYVPAEAFRTTVLEEYNKSLTVTTGLGLRK
jgi:tripartite-type tricarboxylate transporter receptor subunit TctC